HGSRGGAPHRCSTWNSVGSAAGAAIGPGSPRLLPAREKGPVPHPGLTTALAAMTAGAWQTVRDVPSERSGGPAGLRRPSPRGTVGDLAHPLRPRAGTVVPPGSRGQERLGRDRSNIRFGNGGKVEPGE